MGFEKGVQLLLKGDAGVSALVSGRIFANRVPRTATTSTYPCIVYQVIATRDINSIDGFSGLRFRRVQFDSYAENYAASVAVSDAIRALLKNYIGQTLPDDGSPPAEVRVNGCVILADMDFPFDSSASSLYFRRTLEVEFEYSES